MQQEGGEKNGFFVLREVRNAFDNKRETCQFFTSSRKMQKSRLPPQRLNYFKEGSLWLLVQKFILFFCILLSAQSIYVIASFFFL